MILLWSILISFIALPAPVQRTSGESPKKVFEDYWTMETQGLRLTADGWNKANSFARRSLPKPKNPEIAVIYDDFSVGEPVVKGTSAEITIGVRRAGLIDSQFRYKPITTGTKEGLIYRLSQDEPTNSKPSWKLAEPSRLIWLTLPTAIRYLSDIEKEGLEPAHKENVRRALFSLRKLQKAESSR